MIVATPYFLFSLKFIVVGMSGLSLILDVFRVYIMLPRKYPEVIRAIYQPTDQGYAANLVA